MNTIRVVGDVHGKYKQYMNIIHNSEYSVQLGDMGFQYYHLTQLDPDKHKFFKGNHDNHDINSHHDLGPYGWWTMNGVSFFFVSGGFSIDWQWRRQEELLGHGKSWWPNEELDHNTMLQCLALYEIVKPDFVISHEQPTVMVDKVGDKGVLPRFGFSEDWKSNTQLLLQAMYEAHKPKLWIAGHFHKRMIWEQDGTKFVSLQELGYVDINENLEIA